ncbi:hypothetical protein Hypma_016614 [Hypsizygus marmoreus]|uniref:Uncharacterized protein n=1 Tax=Hypsizygus marmoreus TaxID=39966 RepID=A0A369IXT3_HYPMA|nr:hypothetical protein Hypma_016614 [Hypsizygus marmoreus]
MKDWPTGDIEALAGMIIPLIGNGSTTSNPPGTAINNAPSDWDGARSQTLGQVQNLLPGGSGGATCAPTDTVINRAPPEWDDVLSQTLSQVQGLLPGGAGSSLATLPFEGQRTDVSTIGATATNPVNYLCQGLFSDESTAHTDPSVVTSAPVSFSLTFQNSEYFTGSAAPVVLSGISQTPIPHAAPSFQQSSGWDTFELPTGNVFLLRFTEVLKILKAYTPPSAYPRHHPVLPHQRTAVSQYSISTALSSAYPSQPSRGSQQPESNDSAGPSLPPTGLPPSPRAEFRQPEESFGIGNPAAVQSSSNPHQRISSAESGAGESAPTGVGRSSAVQSSSGPHQRVFSKLLKRPLRATPRRNVQAEAAEE